MTLNKKVVALLCILVFVFIYFYIGWGENRGAMENLTTSVTPIGGTNETETTTYSLVVRTTTTREKPEGINKSIVRRPYLSDELMYKELSETKTFKLDNESQICLKGPLIIVRMYSNSTCEECIWVKDIYDKVAREWESYDKIYPIRWEIDSGDNALTEDVEGGIPPEEMHLFRRYSPEKVIPTFILGCKYYREGAGYYQTRDKESEERELQETIQELVQYYNGKEFVESYLSAEPPKVMLSQTTSSVFTSSTSVMETTSTSSSTTILLTSSTTIKKDERLPENTFEPQIEVTPPIESLEVTPEPLP